MKVCIYLRKSRADEEAEKQGLGETLSKHRKALLKVAKEKELNIVEIKEEIVSGESLFHRPKMLELLKEVEASVYDGVLVMDMQRLGRGDMQDQGLILKTFKDSKTKIITPQKTYDLANEWDEEYSEFEAFMSRKELKMINRRMQGGRIRSVEDGNYIGTRPPTGYDIHFLGNSRTLIPNKDADMVKLIFDMYVNQNMGCGMIAGELNKLGFKTLTGKDFERTTVTGIIKNLVYIGKITWKKKENKKSIIEGKRRDSKIRDKAEWIIAQGKHEPIISEELFYKAQEINNNRQHIPSPNAYAPANPMAGLIICSVCGNKMSMRKYADKKPHLICTKKCGNKSTRIDYVEDALMDGLEDWLQNYKEEISNTKKKTNNTVYLKQIESIKKELETLNIQKLKLYDLLEQGIYDNNTFLERSNNISDRQDVLNSQIELINLKIIEENETISEKEHYSFCKNSIQAYRMSTDVSVKNKLLKGMLIKADYKKDKNQKNNDFTLIIYPKLLKSV